jgi:hypothetical protein
MKKSILSMLIVAVAMMTSASAFAGDHPAYLKALADLRAARWLIDHRPAKDWVQSADEAAAVRAIDAAIKEIRGAAIDDHKDINDHMGAQEVNDRAGRLRAAVDLLRKTRADIAQREDDKFAQGLRNRAFVHIDEAIRSTEKAIAAR